MFSREFKGPDVTVKSYNLEVKRVGLKRLAGVGLALALACGYAITSGPGHATDWSAFRAWTLGQPHQMGVWNPYWTKLILLPVAGLPQDMGHFFVNMATFTSVLAASGQLASFLSFSINEQAWVGNLDGLIVWGIILARARNPYVVGSGLWLMAIKPQYLPLSLYYVWQNRNYRLFLIPTAGFLLSLVAFGNWIPEWLATFPPTPHSSVNVSFFPWALPVWLLLPFVADKERFCLAAIIVSSPYFNQASLMTIFAFSWPFWPMVVLLALSWLMPTWLGPFTLIYALLLKPHSYYLADFWREMASVWNSRTLSPD